MAGFLEFLFLAFTLTFSLVVSLGITVPFTGALVRLRANYNPRALQLDPEGNVNVHTGPIVTSFFGMLRRVYRIEGWAGLYKGLMPTASATIVMTGFAVAAMDSKQLARHGRVDPPDVGMLAALVYAAFGTLVSLPAAIITYRSIVTPYRLPWFRPIYSLRVLLTPTERRRPWVLYFTPGLVTAQVLQIAYSVVILYSLRRLLVPVGGDFSPARFGIYVAIEILSTAVICPLEVITTKLAIQRNHSAVEYNSVEQEVEDDAVEAPEYAEYSGQEEDVIGLRHEKDPYLGFADCVKRIIDEEGWQTLYRAWWVTAMAAVLTALAVGASALQTSGVVVGDN
ncbi:mitochondrial carrier [Dichomitus squalens LYAD-421 SS1]|uniref:mitochondrial carrier n=1 Tax=Dichomitus squalens (strain LYAD-421) TaxID=732165 RepID=UPI00044116B6|nr:mitochondrial carrier [Dichomitus squalens LYAD-421 SS1]EJF65405.1 mitochondrial carrier [Dichomitus squalens LYAD-421 SS1]